MKKAWIAGLVLLVGWVASSHAIDRGASMIDTVSFDWEELDDVDGYGGSVRVENMLMPQREDWSILVNVGLGVLSPRPTSTTTTAADGTTTTTSSGSRDVDYWTAGLGLKFYLTPITSFSAVGSFTEYDLRGGDRDAKAATFTAKQRLAPADEQLSPYVKASYSVRSRTSFSRTDEDTSSFSENVFAVGGGFEIGGAENFTFVFEVLVVEADNSEDEAEELDGWMGSIGMQYFWE